MKKIVFLITVFLFCVSADSFAQAPRTIFYSGIYKTSQDFMEGKLSFIVNCDSSSGKIKVHHFFSDKYVDVIRNEKKYRLSKDSIFGYRNCKGKDFRFYENNSYEYQIEEAKGIIIYTVLLDDPSYTGKGIKLVTTYFFSKTLNSNILPLTVMDLKQAFRENDKFCKMLDSEKNITAYDDTHKMFQVNYLLTQSINALQ